MEIRALNRMKDRHFNLCELRAKAKRYKDEIQKLALTPEVKRYLELLEESRGVIQYANYTDAVIYKQALMLNMAIESNSIYLYMGSFKYSIDKHYTSFSNEIKVPYNDPCVTYSRYKNIERDKDVQIIPVKQREIFEKNNKIIYIGEDVTEQDYEELQILYVKTCIFESQEKAILNVMSFNNKKTDNNN